MCTSDTTKSKEVQGDYEHTFSGNQINFHFQSMLISCPFSTTFSSIYRPLKIQTSPTMKMKKTSEEEKNPMTISNVLILILQMMMELVRDKKVIYSNNHNENTAPLQHSNCESNDSNERFWEIPETNKLFGSHCSSEHANVIDVTIIRIKK